MAAPGDPPRSPARPAPRRWRGLRLALGVVVGALMALALLAAWLVGTSAGLSAAAALAESASGGAIRLRGLEGRLADRFAIASLRVALPDLRIEADGIELAWSPRALLDERLTLHRVALSALRLAARPGDATPITMPASLALPFAVRVEEFTLREFRLHAWREDGFGPPTAEVGSIAAAFSADMDGFQLDTAEATLPWGRAALHGRLQSLAPFPLQLDGRFDGALDGREVHLTLTAQGDLRRPTLVLEAQGAGLSGHARIAARPFAPVPVESAAISVGEIDPTAFADGAPRAALQVEATLAVAEAPAGTAPPPEDWVLSGPVTVENRAPGRWESGRMPVERLAATVRWSAGELRADALQALLAGGGRIDGSARWTPLADDPVGRFEADLALGRVDPRALDGRLPAARVGGRIEASGDGHRQRLAATLAGEGLALDAAAAHEGAQLTVSRLKLTRGDARLEGSGQITLDPRRAFAATVSVSDFDPRPWYADAPEARLGAELVLAGELTDPPRIGITYRLAPSTLAGRALAGEGTLTVAGPRLAAADLWLALAGNRIEARGAYGEPGDELELDVDARALQAIHEDLRGTAAVHARLGGTPEAPTGTVLANASQLLLPGGWRVNGLNLQGELQRGLDGPFVLAAGIGEVRGPDRELLLDRAGLAVEGSRGAHRASFDVHGADGDDLALRVQGGLAEDMTWQGQVEALETAGRVALQLTAPADLLLSRDAVRVGRAQFTAGEGRVELARTEWNAAGLWLSGRISGLGFGLAHDRQGRTRRGEGELRIGAEWDFRVDRNLDGVARLYRESGDLVLVGDAPARLGLTEAEATLSASDGDLALSMVARGRQLGRLAASASARVERDGAALRLVPDAPLLGSASLDMPSIGWLGPLANASLTTGGALKADFSLAGTPAAPLAAGRLLGSDLDLGLADVGLRLSGGTLQAEFDRDYLHIVRLDFASPNRVRPRESRIPLARLTAEPGRFEASGGIDLASGEGRFGFRAERLPLLQRPDRWLAVSGEGSIDSGWQRLELRAALEADAGAITFGDAPAPSLSDDVVVLGREREAGRFAVSADLALNLGKAFYLTALGLDTRLEGGLEVRVRPGRETAASGTIRLEDGVYEGYGHTLAVENSSVSFAGPPENPSLNVTALRKGLEVEAGVAITGTARRPRVQLVSFPNVPDAEKLSWIVLGRAPDTSDSADLGLLIPAAQALLGGTGGGITSQLSTSLGLDQFSIGQGDLNSVGRGATSAVVDSGARTTSARTVSGQVVTLGKRLSVDTFLAFEQSLAGAESIVKLTHQLGRRVSVVARGGTDNAIDVFYTFTFR